MSSPLGITFAHPSPFASLSRRSPLLNLPTRFPSTLPLSFEFPKPSSRPLPLLLILTVKANVLSKYSHQLN